MTLHNTLHDLLAAFRAYLSEQAPDIASFCKGALDHDLPEKMLEPRLLGGAKRLRDEPPAAAPATQGLLDRVRAAAPYLHWRQSYTEADPWIDAHYLANYAWFNLVAPSGPFVSDDLRLSVGYWGQGLIYPRHWHEPEEIYLTIAGSTTYLSEGRAPLLGGPGTTVCHYANQPHAARMDKAPLLAAAFWRGDELEAKSVIDA